MNDEEERVMKLCFAPLNSLIEYPSGERYVVSGNPIWSHSNGWYGGGSTDSGVLLIDRHGHRVKPRSLSEKIKVIHRDFENCHDNMGLLPFGQWRVAKVDKDHRLEQVIEQKTRKPVVKLNPFL